MPITPPAIRSAVAGILAFPLSLNQAIHAFLRAVVYHAARLNARLRAVQEAAPRIGCQPGGRQAAPARAARRATDHRRGTPPCHDRDSCLIAFDTCTPLHYTGPDVALETASLFPSPHSRHFGWIEPSAGAVRGRRRLALNPSISCMHTGIQAAPRDASAWWDRDGAPWVDVAVRGMETAENPGRHSEGERSIWAAVPYLRGSF